MKQKSMSFSSLRDYYVKHLVIDVVKNLAIPEVLFRKEFKIQLFDHNKFKLDRFTDEEDQVDLQEVSHLMTRTRHLWLIVEGIFLRIPCCGYSASPYYQQFWRLETSYNNFHEFIDHVSYESDEFRMFVYKIRKCSILHVHDWTSCPFAHQGEKACRRDPRRYNYLPIPCPGYKFASTCIKGDNCELCHGVFEYWLHPAKYRTSPCHYGTSCNRSVCFFAHTPRELRLETKYNWCYVHQYPSHIQPYPDVLIENEPNGNWMIIPCNPQLQPPSHSQYYDTTVSAQQIPREHTSMHELPVLHPPSQSQSRTGQTIQNESDFSLFSASHAKLIEELKNLEIGSTSQVNIDKMHDDKGKRPVESELQDHEDKGKMPAELESENHEFSSIDWVSDLLVDEFEGTNL